MDGSQTPNRRRSARRREPLASLGFGDGEGEPGHDADDEREGQKSLKRPSGSSSKSRGKRKRSDTLSEQGDAPSTPSHLHQRERDEAYDRVVRASLREFARFAPRNGGNKSLAAASLEMVHDTGRYNKKEEGPKKQVILSTGFGNVMLSKARESNAAFVRTLNRDYPGQDLEKGHYSAFVPHIQWDDHELISQVLSALKTLNSDSLSTREREPATKRRKMNEPGKATTPADAPDAPRNQAIALLIGVANSENQRTGIAKLIRAALRYQLSTSGVSGHDLFIKKGAAITQALRGGLAINRELINRNTLSEEAFKAVQYMSDSSDDEESSPLTKRSENEENRLAAVDVHKTLIATPKERKKMMAGLSHEGKAFVEGIFPEKSEGR